jgi:uncharacterized protein YcbX
MLTISGIYVYPVKSLGGISLEAATLTDRGLQHDRRWMLVDQSGQFLSQREIPELALLQVRLGENGFFVHPKSNPADQIELPFTLVDRPAIQVTVWDDGCTALLAEDHLNAWFSARLNMPVRLVYMPDNTLRRVDPRYAQHQEITSFSDGYPLLMIGQASLDDLNSRLAAPVPMNRFRPNLVFTGGEAFEEDRLGKFSINQIRMACVKPCARCVVTTIDQDTAVAGKDPLKTLAGYRSREHKVLFGQNLLFEGSGIIRLGDQLIRN